MYITDGATRKEKFRYFFSLDSIKEKFVSNLLKVENILEDSLDSIPSPSPSVIIQIIGGKFYLM